MSQFDAAHVISYYCSIVTNNYGPILYHFPHITRHWSKIVTFTYLTCIQCPYRRRPCWNFTKIFSIGKTRPMWLPYAEESIMICYSV